MTKQQANNIVKEIKSEIKSDVIRDYEMPTLCNMDTCRETGFAVVMSLSGKYDYTSDVLSKWKERLNADDYILSVKHNQLIVRFNVMQK